MTGVIEDTAPAWLPEHDYLPQEDRSVIRALRNAPGLVSYEDFWCSPTPAPSMNIMVGPGRAIIDGAVAPWLQGSYVVYSPSPQQLPVNPAQNLIRRDMVVLEVLDPENSVPVPGQGYGWRRRVVPGNPGSGTMPPLPDNSLMIGEVIVPPTATAITQVAPVPTGFTQGYIEWWNRRKASGSILWHQSNSRFQTLMYGGWNGYDLDPFVDIPQGFPFPVMAQFFCSFRCSGDQAGTHQAYWNWQPGTAAPRTADMAASTSFGWDYAHISMNSSFIFGPNQSIKGWLRHDRSTSTSTSHLYGQWSINIFPAPAGLYLHTWQPPPNWAYT